MTSDKNKFGGVAGSLYTPMSECEQEVLDRIIHSGEVRLLLAFNCKNIQYKLDEIERPTIKHGDARVRVDIDAIMTGPMVAMSAYSLELSLLYKDRTLFKETQSLVYEEGAFMIGKGVHLLMSWDIQIRKMSSELVKEVKTGAVGLTTRDGNTNYDHDTNHELRKLRERESLVRADNQKKLVNAQKKMLEDQK